MGLINCVHAQVRAVGLSNETPWGLMKCLQACGWLGGWLGACVIEFSFSSRVHKTYCTALLLYCQADKVLKSQS